MTGHGRPTRTPRETPDGGKASGAKRLLSRERPVRNRTSEVARGMYAMGIRKGDHVAIWSTNTPEWMLTMFASAKLGAILVTVNTNYKQFELN